MLSIVVRVDGRVHLRDGFTVRLPVHKKLPGRVWYDSTSSIVQLLFALSLTCGCEELAKAADLEKVGFIV